MSDPVEVVLVQRQTKGVEGWVALFFTDLLLCAGAGLALMLLVPLAHETLGTPDLHPGYLACVALIYLTRSALVGVRGSRPLASGTKR